MKRKLTTGKVTIRYKVIGRCFKCGGLTWFTPHRKSLCPNCRLACETLTIDPIPKEYNSLKYRKARAKMIQKLKMCQLCGATKHLTAHHIGGREDLGLTCLCVSCHRAYERWNQKRK